MCRTYLVLVSVDCCDFAVQQDSDGGGDVDMEDQSMHGRGVFILTVRSFLNSVTLSYLYVHDTATSLVINVEKNVVYLHFCTCSSRYSNRTYDSYSYVLLSYVRHNSYDTVVC